MFVHRVPRHTASMAERDTNMAWPADVPACSLCTLSRPQESHSAINKKTPTLSIWPGHGSPNSLTDTPYIEMRGLEERGKVRSVLGSYKQSTEATYDFLSFPVRAFPLNQYYEYMRALPLGKGVQPAATGAACPPQSEEYPTP